MKISRRIADLKNLILETSAVSVHSIHVPAPINAPKKKVADTISNPQSHADYIRTVPAYQNVCRFLIIPSKNFPTTYIRLISLNSQGLSLLPILNNSTTLAALQTSGT